MPLWISGGSLHHDRRMDVPWKRSYLSPQMNREITGNEQLQIESIPW